MTFRGWSNSIEERSQKKISLQDNNRLNIGCPHTGEVYKWKKKNGLENKSHFNQHRLL